MSLCHWLVLLVAAQRLGEVVWAQRNERRLRAMGGVEIGARHYPLFFVLHGGWLAALWLLVPPDASVVWPLLVLFALLQAARVWVIASLGRYWTTRIISVPDAPLVLRGPYRWLKHPNYLVVAGEIAVLPLAFGAWLVALVFSALNGLLLWHRIRVEDAALAPRRPRPTTLEHSPPSVADPGRQAAEQLHVDGEVHSVSTLLVTLAAVRGLSAPSIRGRRLLRFAERAPRPPSTASGRSRARRIPDRP